MRIMGAVNESRGNLIWQFKGQGIDLSNSKTQSCFFKNLTLDLKYLNAEAVQGKEAKRQACPHSAQAIEIRQ